MRFFALASVVLLTVGCGGRSPSAQAAPESATPPPPGPHVAEGAPLPGPCATPHAGTDLALAPVVAGLLRPVLVTAPPGDPRLFVVEQNGIVRVLKDGAVLPAPFLDVASEVRTRNPEQGLLGMAFHPKFPADPRVFIHHSQRDSGDTAVVEFRVDSASPDVVDPASAALILEVEQPYGNHNGGHLEFGPRDGFLYIGLGDGGSANDPKANGQNKATLLGSMLRIDVDNASPGLTYGIPADNPFVNDPGARDEIWAWGLRNPWRYHFDPVTGELVIGDVGQHSVEELDYHAPGMAFGANYGWDVYEGGECFERHNACGEAGFEAPLIAMEAYAPCNSITGGPVYRGQCLPDLAGTWFWSDYCHDFVGTFRIRDGKAVDRADLTKRLDPKHTALIGVSSFGVDGFGEVYVLSHRGGVVYRLVGG
ncbi:MAG: PQQ-dependent sugar dehydrogenase [Proteobacteria bacterium]|nr:PQQ-dependent sugar dehydrogenase [Pseudomonadota bacterium]